MSELNKPNEGGSGGSLIGLLESFMERYLREHVEGFTPVSVVSVDGATVTVQPLVMTMATDGNRARKARVSGVPIFKFGTGELFISVPVKVGDFGWCMAGDSDPSLVYQGKNGMDIPNTAHNKKFQFGVFFPLHLLTGSGAQVSNTDALTIQNKDGSVAIEVTGSKIIFKGASEFHDAVEFKKPVLMQDDFEAKKGMMNNGKRVDSNHTHNGVQSGNQTSGGVS